jgi:formylglycine-generating enzyme required for sulfatase activity
VWEQGNCLYTVARIFSSHFSNLPHLRPAGGIPGFEGVDSAKENTSETDIDQTSAVGIFPNGASPYGVMDMSGNVWEWCLNNYEKPAPEARNENLRSDKNRVLRGGSFVYGDDRARAVYRSHNRAAIRVSTFGFRLFCVLRPPSS